jgi:hypothetical protein
MRSRWRAPLAVVGLAGLLFMLAPASASAATQAFKAAAAACPTPDAAPSSPSTGLPEQSSGMPTTSCLSHFGLVARPGIVLRQAEVTPRPDRFSATGARDRIAALAPVRKLIVLGGLAALLALAVASLRPRERRRVSPNQ